MSELVPVACFLRSLPLLFRAAPKTPLRVLAVMAIDTLHVRRHSKALTRQKMTELALLLDFQACANAACDDKHLCRVHYRVMRQRLEEAGLGPAIAEYLRRLSDLESRRPSVGGDCRRFGDVRLYREAVVRLSLATAIAMDAGRLDEEIQATQCDHDANALFRIVMQCQIIDDVVDYRVDRAAGLPSFLTACASWPQAIELTAQAVRHYAASPAESSPSPGRPSPPRLWWTGRGTGAAFAFRMALRACTALTKVVVSVAGWRHRHGRRALTPEGRPSLESRS